MSSDEVYLMPIRKYLIGTAAAVIILLDLGRPGVSLAKSGPSAATLPSITLQSSLRARAAPALVEWSSDGSAIISLPVSFLNGWLTVQSPSGRLLEEHALPSAWTYHQLISTHEVIMPGDARAGVAFVVEDVATGKVVFRAMDPAPNAPGTASGAVRFALPADKSVVAVGYGFPRSNQPITLFDTRDWRKVATLVVPAGGPAGVGAMRLSNDGKELAYAGSHGLTVADVRSGDIVRRLPVVSSEFAFSPDGRLLAVGTGVASAAGNHPEPSRLHVFRVSDGAAVASLTPAGSPHLYNIQWGPHGKFLVFLGDNKTIHIWNPNSGEIEEKTIELHSTSRSLSLSPSGKFLAVGDGAAIDIFKVGG